MEEQDGALRVCNQLRDRMYARFLRWQDIMELECVSHPDGIPEWETHRRGISAADRHDPRLNNYETDKAELVEETVWQHMVAGDLTFDAEMHYPETTQILGGTRVYLTV